MVGVDVIGVQRNLVQENIQEQISGLQGELCKTGVGRPQNK